MFEAWLPLKTPLERLMWIKRRIGGGASWVWRTITGAAPLTLANAVHHAIQSLTQFGLCVQSSTPTPDAPVDIYCNGGKIVCNDPELPEGYARIASMTMDDNCYYVVPNFRLSGDDTLRFSFSVTAACNVLGCYTTPTAQTNYSFYATTTATGAYMRYNGGTYNSRVDANTRYDVVITPTGSRGLRTDSTWEQKEFTAESDMMIGNTSEAATSAKFKGTFYGNFEVENASGLRFKGIQCVRLTDSVVGWYDTVSQAFIAPVEGRVNPTAGDYDDSNYSLRVEGTPETLTIHGANYLDPDKCALVDVSTSITGRAGWIVALPAGSYTISMWTPEASNTPVYARKREGSADAWSDYSTITANNPVTLTLSADGSIVVYSSANTSVDTMAARSVMLEGGSTASEDYQPYVEQTVTVPTLLSVDTVKDEWEAVHGPLTHRIGIYVIKGTDDEGWGETATSSGTFFADCLPVAVRHPAKSLFTRYKGVDSSTAVSGMTNRTAKCGSTSNRQRIFIRDTSCADVDALKAKLAGFYADGEPCIVAFALATETTEQGTAHALHTSEGTNVVDVTANVSPVDLSVEYASTQVGFGFGNPNE